MSAYFSCLSCGHGFDYGASDQPRCPRCGSSQIEANPFLLGSDETPEEAEDYFDIALGPCCQATPLSWEDYKANLRRLPVPDEKK